MISGESLVRLLRNNSAHSGQSSQLLYDANDRDAQLLPTFAGSNLVRMREAAALC